MQQASSRRTAATAYRRAARGRACAADPVIFCQTLRSVVPFYWDVLVHLVPMILKEFATHRRLSIPRSTIDIKKIIYSSSRIISIIRPGTRLLLYSHCGTAAAANAPAARMLINAVSSAVYRASAARAMALGAARIIQYNTSGILGWPSRRQRHAILLISAPSPRSPPAAHLRR